MSQMGRCCMSLLATVSLLMTVSVPLISFLFYMLWFLSALVGWSLLFSDFRREGGGHSLWPETPAKDQAFHREL